MAHARLQSDEDDDAAGASREEQKAKWGADRKRSRGTDEEAEVMQRYVSWKSAVAPCIKHSAARIVTLRKHQQSVQARVQSAG